MPRGRYYPHFTDRDSGLKTIKKEPCSPEGESRDKPPAASGSMGVVKPERTMGTRCCSALVTRLDLVCFNLTNKARKQAQRILGYQR